jgi:hypothetical protein
MTSTLATILDKCKLSERDTTRLCHAFLKAVHLDPSEYVINRTSVRKQRNFERENIASTSKEKFIASNLSGLTLHWDGKMLPDILGKPTERLAVVVTGKNIEKLLGVPELPSGTGKDMSSAVHDLVEEWSLRDKIEAFSFDTTASNTGKFNGACTLLEKKLGKNVLYFGCRHHIAEIILSTVFKLFSESTGPDIRLFKNFQGAWANIKKEEYKSGRDDLKNVFHDDDCNFEGLINFCRVNLQEKWRRSDYKEFLELILLFLGSDIETNQITVKKPGAFHHARWMAKAIYSLKIYLYREQFKLSANDKKTILHVNAFVVKCYARYWFTTHRPEKAPMVDLKFLRSLFNYPVKNVSQTTVQKFVRHLYYLSEECVLFSLFDDEVITETKRKIRDKIFPFVKDNIEVVLSEVEEDQEILNEGELEENEDEEEESAPKKLRVDVRNLNEFFELTDDDILVRLVGYDSCKLFKRYSIPTDFLQKDPVEWKNDESFKIGADIITNLKVTNDTAERGIKLLSDFNNTVTKDGKQQIFLLQVSNSSIFQIFL